VAVSASTVLSLFSGVGGLDLGVKLAMPGARVVCYVEREAHCAAALVARMADEALDRAPVWDDVATFDGRPWRGLVDIICGGFPCQDISCAGRGEGLAGARSGLWWEFARIIGEVGPRLVFVENVAALAVRGLDLVIGSLADLGYDARWLPVRASDVGASHGRKRIFILAFPAGWRGRSWWPERARLGWRPPSGESGGEDVADAEGLGGRQREPGQRPEGRAPVSGAGGTALPLFPPGPDDLDAWRQVLEIDPSLEPAIRGVAHGLASRVDRLRACGNGVVPLQAAYAFVVLARRAGVTWRPI